MILPYEPGTWYCRGNCRHASSSSAAGFKKEIIPDYSGDSSPPSKRWSWKAGLCKKDSLWQTTDAALLWWRSLEEQSGSHQQHQEALDTQMAPDKSTAYTSNLWGSGRDSVGPAYLQNCKFINESQFTLLSLCTRGNTQLCLSVWTLLLEFCDYTPTSVVIIYRKNFWQAVPMSNGDVFPNLQRSVWDDETILDCISKVVKFRFSWVLSKDTK